MSKRAVFDYQFGLICYSDSLSLVPTIALHALKTDRFPISLSAAADFEFLIHYAEKKEPPYYLYGSKESNPITLSVYGWLYHNFKLNKQLHFLPFAGYGSEGKIEEKLFDKAFGFAGYSIFAGYPEKIVMRINFRAAVSEEDIWTFYFGLGLILPRDS